MSKSYVCKCEPSVNPTKFWFCREPEGAFLFEGNVRAEFFCDHLNKGTRVEGMALETFHIESRKNALYAIFSDTPFEDLERLGSPAHFPLPELID